MMNSHSQICFNRKEAAILFQGKTVVNLTDVAPDATATIYSSLATDKEGMETQFSITDTEWPFHIHQASLSLRGFIRVIVENRLEIDGMKVDPSLMDVYAALMENDPLFHLSLTQE